MVPGRMTKSYTTNGSCTARNLESEKLDGVIFGCKNRTITECLTNQLFGLPASHFSYVKKVRRGLTLFLFNYSDRTLHGIFEAAGPGQLYINPHGWTSDGDETPYPAQVKVHVRKCCMPLAEEKFAPIIEGNYYEPKLFWFELDKLQTTKLVELFMVSPELGRNPRVKTMDITKDISASTSDTRGKADDGDNAPRGERQDIELNANTGKSWSSLFKPSTTSLPQAICRSLAQSYQSMGEAVSPAISSSADSELFWEEDPWNSANFEEPVNFPASSPSAGDGQNGTREEDPWNSGNFEDNNMKDSAEENMIVPAYNDIDTAPLPRTETDSAEENMIVAAKDHGRNSLDLLIKVAQLVHEIKVLKESQLEQNRRISSLEQELIESKSEIQHFKSRSVLAPAPSSVPLEEAIFEQPKKFPAQVEKLVYMVGGYNGSSWLTNMDSYSVSRDLMRSVSPMTFLRSYSSVTTLNGQLYVLGGAEGNVWYDTVEFYCPSTDRWDHLPSLTKKKGSMASASLLEKIYAIGGGDGVDVFSEVEMFDFNHGKWIGIQTMNQKRFASAATEIDNALYVVGGYDGKDYLSSSARLDPREEKWTKIGTMHNRRGCHSVVAFNGRLFALGGFDGSKMVSSVEVLDPRFGSWSEALPMDASRGYSGAVVMDGQIYIFGGVDQRDEVLNTIECYSEDSGWQKTDLKAMGKRCFLSAVVL